MSNEDRLFEKLAGYPTYLKCLHPMWERKHFSDEDWEFMCGDFPNIESFLIRFNIKNGY